MLKITLECEENSREEPVFLHHAFDYHTESATTMIKASNVDLRYGMGWVVMMMMPVVQNNMIQDDAVCRDGSIPMMVMHDASLIESVMVMLSSSKKRFSPLHFCPFPLCLLNLYHTSHRQLFVCNV